MYEEHVRLLIGTAMSRYRIPEIDAQTLAHDVFLSYITKMDEVRDCRAWLVGAMCNASKHYLRAQRRHVELEPDVFEAPNTVHHELAARECFECLTPRCQLALRLRYLAGYSLQEIATELDTTAKYAQKLVSRCLRQAQERYAGTAPS